MENLNAEQVKKALEWAISREFCENCLCTVYGKSMTSFLNEALALINKQETEYNELYELCESYRKELGEVKADTVRKMQERLKAVAHDTYDLNGKVKGYLVLGSEIDQIAKEMLEASSQKELSVVSDVANAQKQRAELDECTESRYATMFQEEKDNG